MSLDPTKRRVPESLMSSLLVNLMGKSNRNGGSHCLSALDMHFPSLSYTSILNGRPRKPIAHHLAVLSTNDVS